MAARPEFRKSQGVVPFGVGAVIDFKEEALMSAGLDVWPTEKATGQNSVALMEACRVIDGRLAGRLTAELGRKISFFLTPVEAPERAGHGERGSLLITSQVPVSKWHEVIADPTLGDAILDRIVHRAHRIELKCPSLRRTLVAAEAPTA